MREHGVGTRSPRSSAASPRSEAERRDPPRAGAERRTRTFAGSSGASPTDWQSTTSSSTRAASAATRSSVCASAGCSASSVCVTKTSRIARLVRVDERRGSAPRSSSGPRVPVRRYRSARGRTEPLCELAVREHALESLRERVGVGRRDEQALDAVVDEVGDAAAVRRDDGPAARERLDHDAAEPLRPRRQHEHGRTVERRGDLRRARARRGARRGPGSRARSCSTTSRCEPWPTITSRASGSAGASDAPGARQSLDVLVALERADEDDRRAAPAAVRPAAR